MLIYYNGHTVRCQGILSFTGSYVELAPVLDFTIQPNMETCEVPWIITTLSQWGFLTCVHKFPRCP